MHIPTYLTFSFIDLLIYETYKPWREHFVENESYNTNQIILWLCDTVWRYSRCAFIKSTTFTDFKNSKHVLVWTGCVKASRLKQALLSEHAMQTKTNRCACRIRQLGTVHHAHDRRKSNLWIWCNCLNVENLVLHVVLVMWFTALVLR